MTRKLILFSAVLLLLGSPALAGLEIGDKAPPVKAAKWMTQAPPALPGGKDADKHVFVVEFWATWCAPCLKSIPHLAELHRKHREAGLVIIAVSNEESETVEKFLKAEVGGKKRDMPYHVAVDDDNATSEVWTKDVEGIPHAFIVDRTNTIVWQGNPLDTGAFDSAIEKVLAGKYDLEAAKDASRKEKKANELMNQLQAAYRAKDEAKLFEILDQIIALRPDQVQPYLIKRGLLIEFKKSDQVPAWNEKILAAFKDAPNSLQQIAAFELGKDAADRDADLLLRTILRANELSKGGDAETLAVLAQVQIEAGLIEAAIATQEAAIAVAAAADREQMQKKLDYYKALRKLAKELNLAKANSKKPH